MIRDQLAEHTTDLKLREKLFISPNDLPLSKAVEMAFQLESAAQLTSQLPAPDRSPPHSALLAQTVIPAAQPSCPTISQDELGVNVAVQRGATVRRLCGSCGSSSHSTRAPVCPTTGQRCQRCGKLNHFSKVCRSAPANTRPQHRSSSPTVELDGVCLPLLLDTAASKSFLNEPTVWRLFSHRTLRTDAEELYGLDLQPRGDQEEDRWPTSLR